MNRNLLFILLFGGLFVSCTSEYDERLAEAKKLRQRYLMVEETNMFSPKESLLKELENIEEEIDYLAKVSGNEHTFFRDLDNF